MVSSIGSILRQAYIKDVEKLNILTFVTHERACSNLCLTGHNFFSLHGPGTRSWNTKVSPIPENYNMYKVDNWDESMLSGLPKDIEIDCVISQNRFLHYQLAKTIQKRLGIVMLTYEHTDVYNSWPEEYIKHLSTMKGDIDIFISEYSMERWMCKDATIIEHYVNPDLFKRTTDKYPYAYSLVNDFVNRNVPCGFDLWRDITKDGDIPYKIAGDTPGLSKGLNSLQECALEFSKARIYLNTSQFSPLPCSIIESMCSECVPVSSATGMIPEVIEHGVNGFLSNDPKKLKEYIKLLLNDNDLAEKMGKAARQTIVDRFNKEKYLLAWEGVFNRVRNFR